jgi:hypothetical protein
VNAFLELAERQLPNPVKARQRAVEKRAEALDRKKTNDDAGLKEWRRWRQEEVDQALAGPHGEDIATLIARLKAVKRWNDIDSAGIAAAWQSADGGTRALVTRIVNAFVIRLREAAGLPPFDDPVPF